MGLRFRKSVKLGPLRINFSKSGVGYSYGVKGYRVTHTANGRKRTTVSIPGTGISHVTEHSGRRQPVEQKPKPAVPTWVWVAAAVFALVMICAAISN